MYVGLPASLRFLGQKRNAYATIAATLGRISGEHYPVTCSFVFPSDAPAVKGTGEATQSGILAGRYRRVSLMQFPIFRRECFGDLSRAEPKSCIDCFGAARLERCSPQTSSRLLPPSIAHLRKPSRKVDRVTE